MLHKTDGSLATSADARQGYDEGPRNDVLNFPTIRTGPLCGEEVMIPVVRSMIGLRTLIFLWMQHLLGKFP